jgi:hypothetical protein
MADNVTTNTNSTSGAIFACASLTFSGDTAVVQCISPGALSGSEGSWTYTLFVGGAGAVAAGVQRVTLASDDPAVALLGTIDADTGALATDAAAIEVLLTTISGNITACNTGAIAGTVTANLSATDNAVLDAIALGFATEGDALGDGVLLQGDDGTDRTNVLVDTDGHLQVDVLSTASHAVTNAGTFATQATLAAETTKVIGTVNVASGQTIAATNAGTFAVQVNGDALTALQLIDNAVSGAGFNITQLGGAAVPIGAGTEAAAVRVTLATDSTGVVSIDDNGAAITVDGTVAVTGMTACNTGAVVLTTSTASIGKVDVDKVAGASIAVGNGTEATSIRVTVASDSTGQIKLAAGTALAGKVGIDQATANANEVVVKSITAGANLIGDVGLQPRTSGGLSFSKLISGASTNLTQVKATAGQIYGIYATNINAAIRYLKIYDAASASVTVGTTVPDMTLPIPASAAGAGFFLKLSQGIPLGTAISIALTTGVADNDTGAVAANELTVHVFYK